MEHSTPVAATQAFVATMTAWMAGVAEELRRWAASDARTLDDLERQALGAAQELGQGLLAGVYGVLAAGDPAPVQPCPCGQAARYVRHRAARVLTVLGPISVPRAYDHCSARRRTPSRRRWPSWTS